MRTGWLKVIEDHTNAAAMLARKHRDDERDLLLIYLLEMVQIEIQDRLTPGDGSPAKARKLAAATAERMIDVVDMIDGDPDLEDDEREDEREAGIVDAASLILKVPTRHVRRTGPRR